MAEIRPKAETESVSVVHYSMWTFYTSYQLTLTKKFFRLKAHSQDPKKGAQYEIFGDFQRFCPGGTNNVYK